MQSIGSYEGELANNLYKLWNRLSSGSYFPPPVRRVEIPKGDGGRRPLGIPTVADWHGREASFNSTALYPTKAVLPTTLKSPTTGSNSSIMYRDCPRLAVASRPPAIRTLPLGNNAASWRERCWFKLPDKLNVSATGS